MSLNSAPITLKFEGNKVSCGSCSLSQLCLPHGLGVDELDTLDEIINHKPQVDRNSILFRSGASLKGLYAVRSGSFKTYRSTSDGAEQITGFYFPGELLGLDGFGDNIHRCTAQALESSSVCALTMQDFENLCCKISGLRRQLMHLIGTEINQDQETLMTLGQMKGEERLAAFLNNLSLRLEQRGFSANEFNLSMPRHDLANYLGLAVETLSRMFSRMQDEGILTANRRNIHILDWSKLRILAHQDQGCSNNY
jgi:CRP/FNR family transcriptional regulator